MDRRGFLERLGVGAAIVGAAGWLPEAAAQSADEGGPSPRMLFLEVREARERAQRAGRPLLVLVIPKKDEERDARGSAFGEYLNHGSAEQLAPLALCDLATASMADLRRLEPAVGRGEPLMVLLESDGLAPKVRAARARLPESEPWGDAAREEALIERRIVRLASLADELLAGDDALLWRRVSVARAYDVQASLEMDAAIAGDGVPAVELCARAGALALQAARRDPRRRDALQEALRESVTDRFVRQPLPGSYWGTRSSCGSETEDVLPAGYGDDGSPLITVSVCGMGHVPEKSQRFLRFLGTDEPPLCRTPRGRVPGSGYCAPRGTRG